MAQQPNVEISPWDMPAPVLEPPPARRQKTRRPGVILTPDDKPKDPRFGTPGPDTGYALRIISLAGVAEDHPRLRQVLAALMGARASYFGRAPVRGDLDVALELVGLGEKRSEELDARRERWLEVLAHERPPGRTAVAEAGDELYRPFER